MNTTATYLMAIPCPRMERVDIGFRPNTAKQSKPNALDSSS
jgi:hypothetical protein